MIAPDTDPLTTDLNTSVSPPYVLWIQRMPVTKVVNEITLGDFGTTSGCRETTRAWLRVLHQTTGSEEWSGMDAPPAQYSSASVTLSSEPSRLTWQFAPSLVLRRGETYGFRLHLDGCSTIQQTTWEHLGEVEGGPACQRMVPVGDDAQFGPHRRMWHTLGDSDVRSTCVTEPDGFSNDMPGGWLTTATYNGSRWYVAAFAEYPRAPPGDGCNVSMTSRGAVAAFWRFHPSERDVEQYVCMWTQFLPPGEESRTGWFYGLPWRSERYGAPRDVYASFRSVDYTPLLATYKPVYKFDDGEQFLPQKIEAFVEHVDGSGVGTELIDGYDSPYVILARAGASGPPSEPWPLTVGVLGDSYPFAGYPNYTDFLDAPGSDLGDYVDESFYETTRGNGLQIYGRVTSDDEHLWLQYWVFYYYNPFSVGGVGQHEGDWEMIQVALDEDAHPVAAAFATHEEGIGCEWRQLETVDDEGVRPIVFVADGSHASYPYAGETVLDAYGVPYGVDRHEGDDVALPDAPMTVIDDSVSWTQWVGRWGSSSGESFDSGSPIGLSSHDSWSDPEGFYDGATGLCVPVEG